MTLNIVPSSALQVSDLNGELVIDSRLIAANLGIQHETIIKNIRKYANKFQAVGHLRAESGTVINSVGARNQVNFVYLNELQLKLLFSISRNGLSKESIEYFRQNHSMDFSSFQSSTLNRARKSEKEYSAVLSRKLEGKREVKTLAGNIDVLTSTEVIEVKEVKAWKAALGQVVVYGHYYPSHQKRIHLYGETQQDFLDMISSHCKRLGVLLTWEP